MDPAGPRFAADYAPGPDSAQDAGAIRVVSFNIRFAQEIARAPPRSSAAAARRRRPDRAAGDGRSGRGPHRPLAAPRLCLLPRDGPSDHREAVRPRHSQSLAHRAELEGHPPAPEPDPRPAAHRDRCRAANSGAWRCWPMRSTSRHRSRSRRANGRIKPGRSSGTRRAFPGPVVIAGDFNGEAIGLTMRRRGYRWLTEGIGPTVSFFNWDHIFVRRLPPAHSDPAAGVVRRIHGASDHHPVWAVSSGGRPPRPVSPPTAPGTALA